MSQWNSNSADDRKQSDQPPYSRIFIVCNKQTEDDLRDAFERFGEIENIFMPKDRNSGDFKGVAFIKYTKTSSAAAAIDALHLKTLKNGKYIKVMVALSKNDDPHNDNDYKYKRLFIKISKDASEEQISKHFSQFGKVVSVRLQKDRDTHISKGFAYVTFASFYDTALAFENCSKEYKPVFATPKEDLKRYRNNFEPDMYSSNSSLTRDNYNSPSMHKQNDYFSRTGRMNSKISPNLNHCKDVVVTCQPIISQRHLERLFDIIPGMQSCTYTCDTYNGFSKANITYSSEKSALLAVDKLNDFEFPSGEILSVKIDNNPLHKAANNLSNIVDTFKNSWECGNPDLSQLADAIANASAMIKAAANTKASCHSETDVADFCNIYLPPQQPLASSNSSVEERCFLVCKPYPPPIKILTNVFCRFGDLIDVSILPSKNYGFVKYASKKSADEAVHKVNDALVCGIKLKVVLASEKPVKEDTTETETKRLKLDT